jgi:ketosteroid isomerase-like protein
MDDAQALLTRLYEAYNRRDLAAFLALLTTDVDWPDQIQGGRLIGSDAVATYWTTNDQLITVDAAPLSFFTQPDGRLAVDVNQIVRNLAGQTWSDSCVRQIFTLRDGKVARMDIELLDKKPTTTTATDLIVQYYDAIERRDIEAILATIHPDVRFQDFLESGQIEGLAAARDFYQRMFAFAPALDLITVDTLPDERVRAVFQSSIHSPSGHLWSDTRLEAVYTLADGLIQGIELSGQAS